MAPQAEGENTGTPSPDIHNDEQLDLGNQDSAGGEGSEPSASETEANPPAQGDSKGPELSEKHSKLLEQMAGPSTDKSNDVGKDGKPKGKPDPAAAKDGKPPEAAKDGKPAPAAKDQDGKAKVGGGDPYDKNLEAQLAPAAKIAFAKGRAALREATKELETLRPLKEKQAATDFGESLSAMLTEAGVAEDFNNVTDPQLAEVVRTQSTLNRVATAWQARQHPHPEDVKDLRAMHAKFSQSLRDHGIEIEGGGTAEVKPFEGNLPDDLANLVELGADEAQVRLLASIRQQSGKKAPAGQQQRQPAQQEQPPASRRDQGQQQRQPVDRSMSIDQAVQAKLEGSRLMKSMTDAGVPQANLATLLKGKLMPEAIAGLPIIPGHTPIQVWEAVGPARRRELLVERLEVWKETQAAARPAGNGKAPPRTLVKPAQSLTQRNLGPQGRTAAKTTTPALRNATLARMAGEDDEET